jgi:hypothetical protein
MNYISLQMKKGHTGTGEVAALWVNKGDRAKPRSVQIHRRVDATPQQISILSPLYEPLSYPLFWPSGGIGWSEDRKFFGQKLSQIDYYKYLILHEPRFAIFGRLTCEYLCDMYSRTEDERLNFIRLNRRDTVPDDGIEPEEYQDHKFLPRTFHGSAGWTSEMVGRCHALAKQFGNGTFFITMTCNEEWPEIKSVLRPGQSAADRPDVVVRVFRQKLASFIRTLRIMFPVNLCSANRIELIMEQIENGYIIKVVEFQKRGTPHAHLILAVRPHVPFQAIDDCISAEMPRQPGPRMELQRSLVRKFMTHTHTPRCSPHGLCTYNYPKPLQDETIIAPDGKVTHRRREEEDRWIVPHNIYLLEKYHCHINVEICWGPNTFGYLFKYFWKRK